MRPLLLLSAACLGFVAPAQAQWFRPLDRGGSIAAYLMDIHAAAGRRHEIRGDCMSACTMWLGHRGVCVAPDAVLWFHGASDGVQAMRQANPWRAIDPQANAALLAMYPPRVRAVVAPWLDSPAWRTLTGVELIALGVPACADRQGVAADAASQARFAVAAPPNPADRETGGR